MQTDAIALAEARDFCADLLDSSGNFMTKRYRQIVRTQKSAAVMRIRMTNARGANANQNVVRTDVRRFRFRKAQAGRRLSLGESLSSQLHKIFSGQLFHQPLQLQPKQR